MSDTPNPSIEELTATLGVKDPIQRQKARQALIGRGKEAVPALTEALGSSQTGVRWEAAKALVKVADDRAAPALVTALEDKRPGVRWLAAEALIALGPAGVPTLLEALAEQSDSSWLFEGAHHVLHALDKSAIGDTIRPVVEALEQMTRSDTAPLAAAKARQVLQGGA